MSGTIVAVIAENIVILAAIGAGTVLLRQGGGLQVTTPPVPKKTASGTSAAEKTVPFDPAARREAA